MFLGCSDIDPWVYHDLVVDTSRVLEKMGAIVDFRTYSGIGRGIVFGEDGAHLRVVAAREPAGKGRSTG